jgi:hypothetical protein
MIRMQSLVSVLDATARRVYLQIVVGRLCDIQEIVHHGQPAIRRAAVAAFACWS